MDAQKRQKVMLAGLAVLALGAGSYWFLGRDSGNANATAIDTGPIVRKEKPVKEEKLAKKKTDDARKEKRDEPEVIERKEREAPEETTVEKKKKREDKAREKKKVLAPAA